MFKTLVAAVVAASLIGGPVLAQGTTPTTTSNQPAAKTNAPGSNVNVAKTQSVKTAKHVKHRRQIVHARHIKQVKQAKRSAKNKPAG